MSNGATLTILPPSEGLAEILARVKSGEASHVILLAPTLKVARDAVDPLVERGEAFGSSFCRGKKRLSWDNGAILTYFSSEEPDLLRGARCDTLWIERLGELSNLSKITDILGPIILDPTTRVVVTALSPTTLDAWRFLSFSLRAPLPPVRKATKNRLEIILSGEVERFNDSLRKSQEAVGFALGQGLVFDGDAGEFIAKPLEEDSPEESFEEAGGFESLRLRYGIGVDELRQAAREMQALGARANSFYSYILSPLAIGVALASMGVLASLAIRQRGHFSAASAAKLTAREAERGGHMSRTSSSTDSS